MTRSIRFLLASLLFVTMCATVTRAQTPADVTTHHSLELPGGALHFSATAGAIRVDDDKGTQQAEIAFVAYLQEGADPLTRPVTFVFNGGPGMASGWLQVGAVGPWRIALGAPSAPAEPMPNGETWLAFTDLVFIDPPGTGYSRAVASGDEARRRLFSVNGDIDALAQTIRRWLDRSGRSISPKFILGESYGGFRAPRLARALQSQQGVGVSGLVLVSPLLDFGQYSSNYDPMVYVVHLPSQVATARAAEGPVNREQLAAVERYAAGDYLRDLLLGERDPAAIDRVSERVAALTGIDAALVRRYHGRLDTDVFLHEVDRAQDRVGSIYDATVTITDPHPQRALGWYPDPALDGFQAPVTSAMVTIYGTKLHWQPDQTYHLVNNDVFRQWDFGRGMGRPEAVSALQEALALDPRMHVLIAHGLFDLRTPYFATALILDQLADRGSAERVSLKVYPGGHMFYSQDASRRALRDAARELFLAR